MSTKRHPYVYPGKNHNLKFPPEYVTLLTPSKSGFDVQVFHPVKIFRYVSYSVQHNSQSGNQVPLPPAINSYQFGLFLSPMFVGRFPLSFLLSFPFL